MMHCRNTVLSTLAAIGLALGLAPASPVHAAAVSTQKPASSGVWYEIFVRSWYDTNGDGVGDLNGVTAKLDYLKSLGVSGIWLMPINPSPSYHGYDITNYKAVNPQYGTLADFRRLVAEAHKRGIRVIIDMVINHSSNEHPWFKAALNPKSPYRDWYTWAGKYTDVDTPNAFGGKAWQTAADGRHYLGIFSPSMPDLNYDNPAVRRKMIDIGRFWLKQGADGFRLDAARHIYVNLISDQDNPTAVAKNVAWWEQYRKGLDAVDPHAYLVGEVTQPTAVQLAPYMKPLDAVFNFPLATHLIKAARSESNLAIAATLEHVYATYAKASGNKTIKDAPFLSNHDQERVMSQLDGNIQHMRMAAAMLLTLPGEPYIYYGEELGMRGKKPDPDLRTPMRWKRSTDAHGEATWHATSAKNTALSVQAEQADPHSLLHDYTRLIHWRMAIPALRKGGFRAFPHANDHLAVWQRPLSGQGVLVVHNLSGKAQTMPLNVPGQPHYGKVLRASRTGATIDHGVLHLPPYASVVLQ
ncbi:MAG TPA: alpha-amylase family glycosyl hydrolase [Rhodanobacteraceae bacterium]|nr:alpha-amylase family glycosyl hydrolase [Rhodanobacteraceae bacterium]